MRFHRSLVPVLAIALLVGCVHTKKLEVWAKVVEDENGKRVEINKGRHDSAVVQPGDRVAWVCHCDPGTQFTVENLHFVGDLEELAERLTYTKPKAGEELQDLGPTMERALAQLAAQAAAPEDTPREEAAKPLGEGRIRFAGPVGDVLLVVKNEASPVGRERSSLFVGEPAAPSVDFVAATRVIRSRRVAPGLGHELWKFTWKVRLIGDPNSVVTWDPHIFGHPDLKDK